MMNKNRIVVVGSTNIDMVVNTTRIPSPGETVLGSGFFMGSGGKGANQASAIARLGGKVDFISKVGNDVFAKQATQSLREEGMNTDYLLTDPQTPTGVAFITVDATGENSIVVAPGANAKLTSYEVKHCMDKIPDAAILLTQMEIPVDTVESVIQYAAERRMKVILNPAPASALSASCFELIDVITPNRTEAEILTGIKVVDYATAEHAARVLKDKGVKSVVITLGERGAVCICNDAFHVIAATPVKVVDSTAAGDAFNGALACGLAENKEFVSCVRFACYAGAITTTQKGARSSLPRSRDLIAEQAKQSLPGNDL